MKKKYILNGFSTRDIAQKRNHEFALKNGFEETSSTKFMFNVHCLQKEEWGLEVSEDYLNLLDPIEKTPSRLKEIPFQIFMQAYVPMVYRYLDKELISTFFNEGKLRLSSFNKFKKHADEQRSDKDEGQNFIIGNMKDKQFMAMVSSGIDAFVLSSSLMHCKELYEDFKVESCFVIERPVEFMQEIGKHIPEFKGINFGPCIYKPNHQIIRQFPGLDMEALKSDDDPNGMDMNKMFALSNEAGGNEVLFTKTKKYSQQHEYRMLWHSELNPFPDYIDIVAPEAIQFCRIIDRSSEYELDKP
jgi:hypothetical protein